MMVFDTQPAVPILPPSPSSEIDDAPPANLFAALLNLFLPPPPITHGAVPAPADAAAPSEAIIAPAMDGVTLPTPELTSLDQPLPLTPAHPANIGQDNDGDSLAALFDAIDRDESPAQLPLAGDSENLTAAVATEQKNIPADGPLGDELPVDDSHRELSLSAAPSVPVAPPVIFPAAIDLAVGDQRLGETQPRLTTVAGLAPVANVAEPGDNIEMPTLAGPIEAPTEPAAEFAISAPPNSIQITEQPAVAPQPNQITEQPAALPLAANVPTPAVAIAAPINSPSPRPAPVTERELEIDFDPSPAPAPVAVASAPVGKSASRGDGEAGLLGGDHSANAVFQYRGPERQESATPAMPFSAPAPAIQASHGEAPGAAAWQPTVAGLARQIADHLRIGKQQAVLQLDPPDLGKVQIDLRFEDGQLHVRIAAEGSDAQQLIEHHLGDLHQALRGGQIEVANLRVTPGDWQAGGGLAQDFNRSPQERQDEAQGFGDFARREDARSEPPRPTQRRADGRVSMWA